MVLIRKTPKQPRVEKCCERCDGSLMIQLLHGAENAPHSVVGNIEDLLRRFSLGSGSLWRGATFSDLRLVPLSTQNFF